MKSFTGNFAVSAIRAILTFVLMFGMSSAVLASGGDSDKSDDKEKSEQSEKKEKDPVPVSFEPAQKRDISRIEIFAGRVEAIDSVELYARVQGYVAERNYKEGDLVKKGDQLFELEQDIYQNAVDQAEASLKSAQAQQVLSEQQFGRQKELTARDVQSVARLDEATANLDQSRAGVMGANAQLEQAQINLGYTEIKAPIDGLAGRALASVGDLVNPASGPLVTIKSVDPMYVSFPVPQAQMLEIRQRRASGESVIFELGLPDGTIYTHTGEFAFTSNETTSSTDSLPVRITVANPDGVLIDQSLVDVRVTSRDKIEQLTISQKSLLLDQEGAYVFVVGDDDKAQRKRIKTGVQREGFIVVESGLDEGDKVIVDGIQKIQPGAPVKPSPASENQQSEQTAEKKGDNEADKSSDSGSQSESPSDTKKSDD